MPIVQCRIAGDGKVLRSLRRDPFHAAPSPPPNSTESPTFQPPPRYNEPPAFPPPPQYSEPPPPNYVFNPPGGPMPQVEKRFKALRLIAMLIKIAAFVISGLLIIGA